MNEREPLQPTAEERAEDAAFLRLYGDWAPLGPEEAADFFAGFERPWWIVGGWAIEAFCRAPREHEDIDVSILECDLDALRAHVGNRWHLWSNDGGTLRPLSDRHPEPLGSGAQIWVRRSAADPWILDIPTTPDDGGRWTNKRLPDHVADLDEVTWIDEDGLRYLNPEIVLMYKCALGRAKDERDLRLVWPLLSDDARSWLREAVVRLEVSRLELPAA